MLKILIFSLLLIFFLAFWTWVFRGRDRFPDLDN